MKRIYTLVFSLTISLTAFSQEPGTLPKGFAPGELEQMPAYLQQVTQNASSRAGITTPPGGSLRNMAQWEEVQGLLITWTSYQSILAEIVRAAQTETKVYIHCSDSTTVKNYLTSKSVPLVNLKFIIAPFNSIWIRDYGVNSVYRNNVDSLLLVDWIYNRPRPADDELASYDAAAMNLPLYRTTALPTDLVNTGGNWMVDGLGTAFASKLILEENAAGGQFNLSNKTEAQIDDIVNKFHGINRYIKMETLPYDGIHHIDMHMKLLDEETILIGKYPTGVADGPQIEANMLYVLDNFNSSFGTPYKVIRIPMPPNTNGSWPSGSGSYNTYTNQVFINKTIIVPGYRDEYDTTAKRILKESLPGYKIKFIDVDNQGANLISLSGALHCITHSVGVNDPLWIVHQKLNDTYQTTGTYAVNARIEHRTGISTAKVFFRTDTLQPYQSVDMSLTNVAQNTWTGQMPAQPEDSKVYYYIEATANSGKQQSRPMPAPAGWWRFKVMKNPNMGIESTEQPFAESLFPNPASDITCVPLQFVNATKANLYIADLNGKIVKNIHSGVFPAGESRYYINAKELAAGVYSVVIESAHSRNVQKLLVK